MNEAFLLKTKLRIFIKLSCKPSEKPHISIPYTFLKHLLVLLFRFRWQKVPYFYFSLSLGHLTSTISHIISF